MKICTKCKKEQALSEFPPRKDRNGNPHSWCQTCLQKRVEAVLKNRQQKRDFIDRIKREQGCRICGIAEPVVLDFHHTGKKTNTISNMLANHVSLERIKEEANQCILLCANCHRMVHAGLLGS